MKKLILFLPFFVLTFFVKAQTNIAPQFKRNIPVDSLLGYSIPGVSGNHWLPDTSWVKKYSPLSLHLFSGATQTVQTTFTASGASAAGVTFNTTTNASANNQILYGTVFNNTSTTGSFTNIQRYSASFIQPILSENSLQVNGYVVGNYWRIQNDLTSGRDHWLSIKDTTGATFAKFTSGRHNLIISSNPADTTEALGITNGLFVRGGVQLKGISSGTAVNGLGLDANGIVVTAIKDTVTYTPLYNGAYSYANIFNGNHTFNGNLTFNGSNYINNATTVVFPNIFTTNGGLVNADGSGDLMQQSSLVFFGRAGGELLVGDNVTNTDAILASFNSTAHTGVQFPYMTAAQRLALNSTISSTGNNYGLTVFQTNANPGIYVLQDQSDTTKWRRLLTTDDLVLTTTGSSGAATYSGGVLNIPVYSGGGGGITALTGDVTASGSGSVATTLATVNSNVGSFGDATHTGTFTVNAKGLITAASATAITFPVTLANAVALTNKDLTSGTNTFPTFNQPTTGNAATATKWAAPITINGTSVDGSGNVTIFANSGANLTNGTGITSLNWNGSTNLSINVDTAGIIASKSWAFAAFTTKAKEASDYTAIGLKQPRSLSNYTLGASASITSADSVVSAFGKVQAEINTNATAIAGVPVYTASAGVVKTANNFTSDTTYNRTVANSLTLAQSQAKFNQKAYALKKSFGLLIPVFQNALKFDNLSASLGATPFGIYSSGGLISTTSGTTASGYLKLPNEVNGSKTTRTDWLVTWDPSETGASMTFGLGNSSTGYTITLANVSGNVVATLHDGTTFTGAISGVVQFSVSFATGNSGITSSVTLLGAPALVGSTNVFKVPCYIFSKLTKNQLYYAYQATNTTSSRIVGFLHNAYSWDGDPTGQLLTSTVIINGGGVPSEHDNIIILPARSNPATPLKVVNFFHGRTETYKYFLDVTQLDSARTARVLLNAGYAIIASSGGVGSSTGETDYWGNAWGTEKAGQVFDALQSNVKNIGKEYLVGWSMGGASACNYARANPDRIGAIWMSCPALDLEENVNSRSIQWSGSSLKTSIDLAYNQWFYSLVASNTADPQTDDGTHWRLVSAPGGQPTMGMRGISATTVASTVTANATVPLTSAARFFPGDDVYFKASGVSARIYWNSTGVPNSVTLDHTVTLLSGEYASILRPYSNIGYDFQWEARPSAEWVSSTQSQYVFVKRKSPHPELDVIPHNPTKFVDFYAELGAPIHIMVGGDGTSTGNDTILNNAPMFAFGAAVNALKSGIVTMISGSGNHVSATTMSASDTLSLFNAN